LLTAVTIYAAIASAGDVKVTVAMTTGPEDKPVTTFAPDTGALYAMFKTEGLKSGDKVRGALIAEEVGAAAPPNTKVLETTLDMEEDTEDGEFNFSKPNKGWPVGKYRVEIYVNDKLANTVKFTVSAGASQ